MEITKNDLEDILTGVTIKTLRVMKSVRDEGDDLNTVDFDYIIECRKRDIVKEAEENTETWINNVISESIISIMRSFKRKQLKQDLNTFDYDKAIRTHVKNLHDKTILERIDMPHDNQEQI